MYPEKAIYGGDLRRMRILAGITTTAMAKFASVKSRKTIENWESDIGSPDINQYLNMCEACGYKSRPFVNATRLHPQTASRLLLMLDRNIDCAVRHDVSQVVTRPEKTQRPKLSFANSST